MAQFRATIKGSRGRASRLGTKKTGMVVTVNGWTAGVIIYADHDPDTGRDSFTIYRTAGSNTPAGGFLASVSEETK